MPAHLVDIAVFCDSDDTHELRLAVDPILDPNALLLDRASRDMKDDANF